MTNEQLFFAAWLVASMYIAALVPKARTVAVILAIGLYLVYPSTEQASFILLFTVPAVLLSAFTER